MYVNYNLRIQNRLAGGVRRDDDDPFRKLMELSMTDANNPIKEWMEVGRSTVAPELDEEDTDSDCPIPSHLVTDTVDPNDLRRETGASNLSKWAKKTIGDTPVGKRKTSTMQPPRRGKKTKGKGKEIVASDDSTDADAGKSPPY